MQGEGRAMIGWKHTSSSGADINAAVLEDNLEELLLLPTQEQVQNTERQDNHRGHLPQLLDQQLSAMNDESSSYSLHQKQQVSSHLSSLPSSSSKILTHSYQYAPPLPWGDLSVIEREGPVQCIAPSLQGHTRLSDEVQLPLPSSNDLPFLNQSFCEACESRNHLNVDSMNEAAVICQPRRFFSPLNPGVALLVAGSPGATSSIATSSPSSIHQWGDQILLSTTTSSFSSFSKESEHYVGRATSREVPLTGAGKSLQDKDDIMLKMRSGSFVNASTKRVIDDVARAHLLSTSFPDHEGHKHPQKEVLEQIHAHLTATEWKNDKISPVLQPCLQPRADILSSSLSIATPLSKNLLESSDVTRISGSCIDMQAVHHNQFHNANQIEDDNLLAISLTSNQVDPDHPSTRSHDHKCGLQRSSQRLLSFGSSGQKTENRARGGNGKMTMVPCKARGMPKDHNMKTAFFVIRENVNHGEGLLCSHIQCQKKGIRFVYCKVCKAPVARVNFSTRHRHSIRDVHAQEGDVLPYEHSCLEFAVPIESDPSYTSTPLFIPPQNTTGALPSSSSTSTPGVVKLSTGVHPLARLESPNEELHTEKGERFADKYKFISRRCQKKRQRKSRGRRSSSDPLQGDGIVHATVAQDIVIKGITISTEEKGWIELLRKRPETTDQIGMKNWLVEVISCTEPDGRA